MIFKRFFFYVFIFNVFILVLYFYGFFDFSYSLCDCDPGISIEELKSRINIVKNDVESFEKELQQRIKEERANHKIEEGKPFYALFPYIYYWLFYGILLVIRLYNKEE